jgi:uncharacterized protein
VSLDSVAVIVVSKFPRPGEVKTRLQPTLSPRQAADVHKAFLLHLAGRLDRIGPAALIIYYDDPDSRTEMRQLLDPVCAATYLPQPQGDLGRRLASAAQVVGVHHPRMLFLGADSPDIPTDHLLGAGSLCEQTPVTLGPATDGGFWCLGLSDQVDAFSLLEGIPWSTGREARQVADRAEALQYAVARAGAWEDVDRPDDLRRLLARLWQSSDADDRRLLSRLQAICSPAFSWQGAEP